MELTEIVDFIKNNISDGEYSLANDLDLGNVFGEQIPIVKDIIIKDADLKWEPPDSTPNIITLAGVVDILGFEDVSIKIKIESKKVQEKNDDGELEEKTIRTYGIHIILPPGQDGNLLYSLVHDTIKALPIPEVLSLPKINFADFNLSLTPTTKEYTIECKAQTGWKFDLGFREFMVGDIDFSFARDSSGKVTGRFNGGLVLGDITIDLDYNIPGKFELKSLIPSVNFSSFFQDLCGDSMVASLLPNLEIRNLSLSLISEDGEFKFNISGESDYGRTQFVIKKKKEEGKWIFVVGFAPPENFKFSEINDALVVLDDISFPNTALILSSGDIESSELSTINIGRDVTLKKGVNLFATFDTSDTFIYQLIGLETLGLTGQIGTNPFSFLLAVSVEGKINIADILELQGFYFEIAVPPLSLALKSKIAVQLAYDLLLFTLAAKLSLKDTTLSLAGTMEGAWNDPFGFKGVSIENLALELGINFSTTPIPLPTFGFAGSLKVGDFDGEVAVKINPTNPSDCVLLIAFNELYLIDIAKIFLTGAIVNALPEGFTKILNKVGFRDVDIHIVPCTTTIGELEYEQGFKIKGKMQFLDWNAEIDLKLDYENGFKVYGKFDPIKVPGLFTFKGAGGSPNPVVDIALIQGEDPYFYVSGYLEILGMRYEADININAEGFQFLVKSKIFDLYSITLLVEGEDLKNAAAFRIRAMLYNDFMEKIAEAIKDALGFFAELVEYVKEALEKAVEYTQAALEEIGGEIRALTDRLNQELSSRIEDATSWLNQKKNELKDAINEEIDMIAQVVTERTEELKNLFSDLNTMLDVRNLIDGIEDIADNAVINDVVSNLANAAENPLATIENVWETSQSFAEEARDAAGSAIDGILDNFDDVVDPIENVLDGIIDEIVGNTISEKISDIAESAIDEVSNIGESIVDKLSDAADWFEEGASAVLGEVGGALSSAWNETTNFFSGLFGGGSRAPAIKALTETDRNTLQELCWQLLTEQMAQIRKQALAQNNASEFMVEVCNYAEEKVKIASGFKLPRLYLPGYYPKWIAKNITDSPIQITPIQKVKALKMAIFVLYEHTQTIVDEILNRSDYILEYIAGYIKEYVQKITDQVPALKADLEIAQAAQAAIEAEQKKDLNQMLAKVALNAINEVKNNVHSSLNKFTRDNMGDQIGAADTEGVQNVSDYLDSKKATCESKIAQIKEQIENLTSCFNNIGLFDSWKKALIYQDIIQSKEKLNLAYYELELIETEQIIAREALAACENASVKVNGIVENPIESDVRMVDAITAKEDAQDSFVEAEKALQQSLNESVDNHPEIIELQKLEENAKIEAQNAQNALNDDKAQEIHNTTKEYTSSGSNFDLINIKSVWFDAKLGASSGGKISLVFDIVLFGNAHKFMFDFDFYDFWGSVQRLVLQVITGDFKAPTQEEMIDLETIVIQKPTLDLPPVPEPPAVVPLLETNPPPIVQSPLLTGPIIIPEQTQPETQVIEPPTQPETQVIEPPTQPETQVTTQPITIEEPIIDEEPITIEESIIDEEPIIIEDIIVIEEKEEEPQAGKIYKSISSILDDISTKDKKNQDNLLDKGEKVVSKLMDKGEKVIKDFIEDGIDNLLDLNPSTKKKKKNKKRKK